MLLLEGQRFAEAGREAVKCCLVVVEGLQSLDARLARVGERALGVEHVEVREGAAIVAFLSERECAFSLRDDVLFSRLHRRRVGCDRAFECCVFARQRPPPCLKFKLRTALFGSRAGNRALIAVEHAKRDRHSRNERAFTGLVFKEQIRAGNLRDRYDVIILPTQGRSTKDIVFDIPVKGKPLPYTKTDRYRFLGDYGASEDVRGGMGLEGVVELRKFVEAGGTLITTGDASAVPVEFGLIDDIVSTRAPGDFYAPGPIVKAKVLQPKNPVFYGYDEAEMPVRWASNTLYGVPERLKGRVMMEFPGGKEGVLSGFMRGADGVKDRAAILNIPQGEGRILMFATNPVWRWQNLGEFRMLYNALINWKQLGITDVAPPVPAPIAAVSAE